jgi:hypothetical protein
MRSGWNPVSLEAFCCCARHPSHVRGTAIGHGLMLTLSIAKWRDSLNSQSPVYVGDEQTPPDPLNLLPEGTDSDPDI